MQIPMSRLTATFNGMGKMKKKELRSVLLVVLVVVLVVIGFFKEVRSFYEYGACILLLVGGFKAVIDFTLGLPIRLGYSDYCPDTEKNQTWRFLLLIGGIIFIILGLVGIFVWNV